MKAAHQDILNITPYKQGQFEEGDFIKLSSNENPFGTSPKALKAIKDFAEKSYLYPDGECIELRKKLAEIHGLKYDNIVCGAGSDELIRLMTHGFAGVGDEVLYSEYGFLMYPISAMRVGATPVFAQEENLRVNVDNMLAKVSDKTKLVFIANPNNPTGSYISKNEIVKLRDGLPENILLVLDNAYAEYMDKDDYTSGEELVEQYGNVVVLRTFSKIYGLAGLRVGWAYCSDHVADVINRIRGPFNVTAIGQAAARAALSDNEFIEKCKAHNSEWLEKLTNQINELGLKVYPSVGNFVLVQFADKEKTKQVHEALLEKGVIGRPVGVYNLHDCLRFTIGKDNENEALIEALKVVV